MDRKFIKFKFEKMANHSLRLRNGNLIIRIIKPEDIGKRIYKVDE